MNIADIQMYMFTLRKDYYIHKQNKSSQILS